MHYNCSEKNTGMIGRWGLPNDNEIEGFRAISQGRQILFLGDLDPTDLLVFMWLRQKLSEGEIVYWGIGDRYLDSIGHDLGEIPHLVCSDNEQLAYSLAADLSPELPLLLGPQCAAAIADGKKVELDAVVSVAGGVHGVLPRYRS
jgi:hypothetical protein